jgi:hypothetical protein
MSELETKTSLGSAQAHRVTEDSRVPMNAPHQRLAVPEIPGFHLHWFTSGRVHRALRAGYTHVVPEDGVDVMNTGLADPKSAVGSTDLGENISIISGDGVPEGQDEPDRLYLMKLPQEWWEKDQKALLARNESIAATLRGGLAGAEDDPEKAKRYLKSGQDLFIPKRNK